tara:strand:+ start:162 stop:275 length:114 start_codon:yes stop_codon:yes gene_type:complete
VDSPEDAFLAKILFLTINFAFACFFFFSFFDATVLAP